MNNNPSQQQQQQSNEVLSLIIGYLLEQKLFSSAVTLKDEANININDSLSKLSQLSRIKKLIINGDWSSAEQLLQKLTINYQNNHPFMYYLYKQEYLELINSQESIRAYEFINKKLKFYEDIANNNSTNEFYSLCYLLTCKCVNECDTFKEWKNPVKERELLADKICDSLASYFQSEIDVFSGIISSNDDDNVVAKEEKLPTANRLLQLLNQAVLYQMSDSLPPATATTTGTNYTTASVSLLEDYKPMNIPSTAYKVMGTNESSSIKCFGIYNNNHQDVVVAGTDNGCLCLWNNNSNNNNNNNNNFEPVVNLSLQEPVSRLQLLSNHAKIRDVAISPYGSMAATAFSNGDVVLTQIKSLNHYNAELGSILDQVHVDDSCDIHSLVFHPSTDHILCGGSSKAVTYYDLTNLEIVRQFKGHNNSVTHISTNKIGNIIISSAKDGSVKFWDTLSGICINTIYPLALSTTSSTRSSSSSSSVGGEITSTVLSSDGYSVLVTSRFSSPRLIDIRNNKIITRYITPLSITDNASSNATYYRPCFVARDDYLCTGGVGYVHLWNTKSGELTNSIMLPQAEMTKSTVFTTLYSSNNGSLYVGTAQGVSIFR